MLALCGRVGRAGLPGALWCASPFPLAASSLCFAWPPPGWGCPPLSRCPCRSSLPWRCALVDFLGPPLPGSSCARASFVSPAWPLAALWWFLPPPLPFCVSRFSSLLHGALVLFFFSFFFLFFSSPSSPVRPRCLRLSLVSGPGCPGPRRCALFALLAFRLSALRALVPLSCFPPGWWLLPGGCCPPPPFCLAVFVAAPRCCMPCAVLCCVSLGAVLRRAAARCVLRCCAVLCCVVLVGCRCLLRRALWRCPLPWGPVLCGAVFFGVPPCCVCFVVARWCVLLFAALLCAVCVPGCCAVRSPSSPFCAVLCFAVLVRSVCAVPVVRAVAGAWCCGVPWCGAGSGGPWLSAGGVFRCRCPCLAAWSVSLWLVWFAVVPCFPVSCSVVLCCRVVLCCCALLSCCGAVGACFALLWAVVLCCVVLLVGCAVFCPVVVKGGPQVGGSATSTLRSRASPDKGTKSKVAHKWAEVLHHPCVLGGPQTRGQSQRRPTSGRKCYISPAFSGVPKRGDKVNAGQQVGGSATSPLRSRGSPNKGTKSKVAHKWAEVLHHPCILGGPRTRGQS